MSLLFKKFNKKLLKGEPETLYVGSNKQHQVNFLPIACEVETDNPPVIILGGAFQNFNSFKYCLDYILPEHPVLMIDLPSLGNNPQIGADLSMENLADILNMFLNDVGVIKVSVMGLSISSIVASTFAYKYADKMHRLLIMGIIPRPRKSWKRLVSESFDFLSEGSTTPFSHAVVLFLSNYSYLKQTGLSSAARRLFQRQMERLDANGQRRYDINGRRLLKLDSILGYPQCETLVITGEYDNFTLPAENAEYALSCPNAQFALIENADHLPQLERRDETMMLFNTFFSGRSIQGAKGIINFKRKHLDKIALRGAPRFTMKNSFATIYSKQDPSFSHPVVISDISFSGCAIHLKTQSGLLTVDDCRGYVLEIPDFNEQFELIVFENDAGKVRCIFLHQDMKLAERYIGWLYKSESTEQIPDHTNALRPGQFREGIALLDANENKQA